MATITALEGVVADTLRIPRARVRRTSRVLKDEGLLLKAPARGGVGPNATAADAAMLVLGVLACACFDGASAEDSARVVRSIQALDFTLYHASEEAIDADGLALSIPRSREAVLESFPAGIGGSTGISGALVGALLMAQAGCPAMPSRVVSLAFGRSMNVPIAEVGLQFRDPSPVGDRPAWISTGARFHYADAAELARYDGDCNSVAGRVLIANRRAIGLTLAASISHASIERIGQALGPLPPETLEKLCAWSPAFAEARALADA